VCSSDLATLEQLAPKFAQLQQDVHAQQAQHTQTILQLAMAIAEKLAGEWIQQAPLEALKPRIIQMLEQMQEMPAIRVHVHPDILAAAQAQLPEIATRAGYGGTITCESSTTLGPTDCTLQWETGQAQFSQSALNDAIADTLQRYMQENTPHTPDEPKE